MKANDMKNEIYKMTDAGEAELLADYRRLAPKIDWNRTSCVVEAIYRATSDRLLDGYTVNIEIPGGQTTSGNPELIRLELGWFETHFGA